MADAVSRAFMAEAKALVDAGQCGEAITVLLQGLTQFPKMMSARVLLGELYWISGEAALARAELEQVLKTTPDNFAACRKLAHVCQALGDRHAAAQACEMVLQANPKDREMKDLLEELLGERLTTQAQGVRTEAPAEEQGKVSDAHRAEETDSDTLAELYIGQGHREKGLAVYRRLVENDPDNMALHERIMALEVEANTDDKAPQETAAQASRQSRTRRLEGWLSVIQGRRGA